MVRTVFLTILWVFTAMLVLFSLISWAGVILRLPALIILVIAIVTTLSKRSARYSRLWVLPCIAGFLMVAVSLGILVHSLATGYSEVSSQARITQNVTH